MGHAPNAGDVIGCVALWSYAVILDWQAVMDVHRFLLGSFPIHFLEGCSIAWLVLSSWFVPPSVMAFCRDLMWSDAVACHPLRTELLFQPSRLHLLWRRLERSNDTGRTIIYGDDCVRLLLLPVTVPPTIPDRTFYRHHHKQLLSIGTFSAANRPTQLQFAVLRCSIVVIAVVEEPALSFDEALVRSVILAHVRRVDSGGFCSNLCSSRSELRARFTLVA